MNNKKKRGGVVRKLMRVGEYSYYVTLPKPAIVALGWRKGQKLAIQQRGKSLVIADWESG